MNVLLLADTHLRTSGKPLPEVLVLQLEKADLILHAGDFIVPEVLGMLNEYAPVKGVFGNVDPARLQEQLNEKESVEIDGIRIGLVHGHLGRGKTTPERAWNAFRQDKPDIIIFGHSHIPYREEVEGVLLYNPGSATAKRFQKQFSYGWLTISNGTFQIETYYF